MPWRAIAFAALLAAYVLLTLGVLYTSPVLTLDSYLLGLDLRHSLPESWKKWISFYVAFGQRGPSTLVFLPFFIWIAWRTRSPRPLVLLGTALILLNVSVGVVKVVIGRLGPLRTHNTHALFYEVGDIYPSGHVSNAVMLYGLMAWIAIEYRRTLLAAAVFLSITVGIGTVYLNTHWFSDVVGGWIAGGLILIALPWVMPTADRLVDRVIVRSRARRKARRSTADSALARPAPKRAMPQRVQGKETPVSSAACSQSLAATAVSFDAPEEPTRLGDPRISPSPFGP